MQNIIALLSVYGFFRAVPLSLAATALYGAVRVIYLRTTGKSRRSAVAETARAMLVYYLATLVVVVWFADLPDFLFGRITAAEFAERTFFRGEYTSNGRFWEIVHGNFYALRDDELLANIALFVPFGILLPLAFKAKWWVTDLAGLGTTLTIELVQPLFGRSCDIDDVIANTLGTVIGCAAAKLVSTLYVRIKG